MDTPTCPAKTFQHFGRALGVRLREADDHALYSILSTQRRKVVKVSKYITVPQRVVVDEADEINARMST